MPIEYPALFESLWIIYPKRNGNNPKRKAFNAYKARLKQGHEHQDIFLGLQRYVKYCSIAKMEGTSYIMHASTFFGPDENFMEEWTPPEPERKAETTEQKGLRLNMPARIGESMEEWERRIQQAR